MKSLFKRKSPDIAESQMQNGVSKGMQVFYNRLRHIWAKWMEKRTAKLSPGNWKMALALFVLLTGGYSIYLAVNGFTSKGTTTFSITPIRKPGHLTETGEAKTTLPQVSQAEYRRIRNFRMYMDSLARSPSGRSVYDSITHNRPGLMDSVRFIENYYQQFKNE